MIDSALYHRLTPVTRRFQLRRLFLTLAVIWTVATFVGLFFWWLKTSGVYYSPLVIPTLLIIKMLATVFGLWFALRSDGESDFSRTARDIEKRFPDLDASLITAVEQQPVTVSGSLGFLQQEVVRKAVYHGYQNPWAQVIPRWQMLVLPILAAAGLLAFGITLLGTFMSPLPDRLAQPTQKAAAPSLLGSGFKGMRVEPGDTDVERYSSVMVLATFGENQLPAEAELVYQTNEGKETITSMNKSLGDPVFGARINSVNEALRYWIRFNGETTDSYQISVFEYPKMVRADADLEFPEYTGEISKTVQDVRRVSAVTGTRVKWRLTLNKAIQSGRLLAADGQQVELIQDLDEPTQYLAEMVLDKSQRFEVELVDEQGRENQSPPTLSVQVTGNSLPEIKQLLPSQDVEVSPVEELKLSATFWDDFGMQQVGVTYALVGQTEREIVLGSDIAAKELYQSNFMLSFESLAAQPNQLLSFFFWAEDLDANGDVRRTLGDIQLVNVRDFESIFRQGQSQPGNNQPPGGEGQQQGEPAMELSELQRNIVYAIWNLSRREIFREVSDSFFNDVQTINESQNAAIEMLNQQSAMVQDADQKMIIAEAKGHMEQTMIHLQEAFEAESVQPLAQALTEAQKADQTLLKLRTNESDVVQNNQQQSGGGGGSQQRQQLEQLQLDNDENRYAEEQTATEQTESNEDRENRQVLSRLRELSRRQNDLNERIKELQSALEEADSTDEQEEIEEQIKRLREEQQQILRDTEELQERMEQPDNQRSMSEQTEQLDEARENARKASDALEQGDVSKAAAEGTRALRNMEDLRDEFQNRSAGQFDQEMQEMRNQARDLERDQQELAEAIQNLEGERSKIEKSLSDSEPENDLEERLAEQSEKLDDLRENIRETIEKAEEFEPILAEKLYDAYRRTQQNTPAEAIDATRRSLERGFMDDAERQYRQAAKGIEQLREDIDDAAESILGDETDALRRANREIERLVDAVEDEERRGRSAGEESAQDSEAIAENDDASGSSAEPNGDIEGQPESNRENGRGTPDDSEARQNGSAAENAGTNEDSPNQAGGGPPTGDEEQVGPGNPQSLRDRGMQDSRGQLGANPEMNYGEGEWSNPLTGEDFMEWSDRMRDVEEMVADPELRGEAARIREDARSIRRDLKRGSGEPNWELIRLKVIEPMVQLQDRVQEELIRRSGDKTMVPVDRDPVPAEFENAVQQYFEKLGQGK